MADASSGSKTIIRSALEVVLATLLISVWWDRCARPMRPAPIRPLLHLTAEVDRSDADDWHARRVWTNATYDSLLRPFFDSFQDDACGASPVLDFGLPGM